MKSFWDKVKRGKKNECWNWTASIKTGGYGQFGFRGKPSMTAHRVAWILTKGEIPEGKWVLHRCDNRRCVNPHHLYLGTRKDNIRDAVDRNRVNKGVKVPSCKLTEKDVKDIRRRYKPRKVSMYKLAKEYGVRHSNIQAIIERRSWKHI